MTLAIDIGALTVTIATDDAEAAPDERAATIAAPTGGGRSAIPAAVRAALAAARPTGGQVPGAICVTVPETWLSGSPDGTGSQEDMRHECEDVAGTGQVTWAGQLAAVAALAARERGYDRRYLVCDIGGTGLRAGMVSVSSGTISGGIASSAVVEILASHAADGGGWRDFDVAVRAGLPAGKAAALPDDWHEQAARQERRAALVLADAADSPEEFGDTRVYKITGPSGEVSLTARTLIDGFGPTLRLLREAIEAVSGGQPPGAVVLTGGLAWLPLAARAVEEATGIAPEVTDPGAAARGGLLFGRGEAVLAPPAERPEVTVPASRIHDGLLEEVNVSLPWTAPFAPVPGGALTIDTERLDLAMDGRSLVAPLPGLVPGPHRIGVRSSWPGPGVLVVRPIAAGNVHVVPLATLTAP